MNFGKIGKTGKISINMKYIEELDNGDAFIINDISYLLTCDFRSNGDRLCFCLSTGLPKWFQPSTIVSLNPIYYLGENNTIIPVKEVKKHEEDSNIF